MTPNPKQRLAMHDGASVWATQRPAEPGLTLFTLAHPYPDLVVAEGEQFHCDMGAFIVVRAAPGTITGRKLEAE